MKQAKVIEGLKARVIDTKDANKAALKKRYASYLPNDWNAILSYDDLNGLLTKVVVNKAFSHVRMFTKAVAAKKRAMNEADYRFVNNISYALDNLPHVVGTAWCMLPAYAEKYKDNAYHGVRCACLNALDKCRRDDHNPKESCMGLNASGEVIDIDAWKAASKDFVDDALTRCAMDAIDNEKDSVIAFMTYYGHKRKTIAVVLGMTAQAVSKRLKKMRIYFE